MQLKNDFKLRGTHVQYAYYTTDVFTNQPFNGAQITVFPEADGLSDQSMQSIANEMSMTETVFVFKGGNPRQPKIRVFSPLKEVGFGSHTTLAAAHVLTSTKSIPFVEQIEKYAFLCGDNTINVHVTNENNQPVFTQFTMTVAPIVDNFAPTREELAAMLGISIDSIDSKAFSPRVVSCGTPYLIVPITSPSVVQSAVFNTQAWRSATTPATWTEEILLVSRQHKVDDGEFYARLVGPHIKLSEEPPVGAAIPAFSGYLCSFPHIRRGTYTFSVARGGNKSRRSMLHIEMDNKGEDQLTIRVGGTAVLMAEGKLNLA